MVLPPLTTPMTPMILPALTGEGRLRPALLLPPRRLPWWPVWWQPQEKRLPPSARSGFAGFATPPAVSSTLSPWLRACKEPGGE